MINYESNEAKDLYLSKCDDLFGQVVLTNSGKMGAIYSFVFDGDLCMITEEDDYGFAERQELLKSYGHLCEDTITKIKSNHYSRKEIPASLRNTISAEIKGMRSFKTMKSDMKSFNLPSWVKTPSYIIPSLSAALTEEIIKCRHLTDETTYERALDSSRSMSDVYYKNIWADIWIHIPNSLKKQADKDKSDLLEAFLPTYVSRGGLRRISLLMDVGDEFEYINNMAEAFDIGSLPQLTSAGRVSEFKDSIKEYFGESLENQESPSISSDIDSID